MIQIRKSVFRFVTSHNNKRRGEESVRDSKTLSYPLDECSLPCPQIPKTTHHTGVCMRAFPPLFYERNPKVFAALCSFLGSFGMITD